ncbi:legumain-like isoform X2 [Planococcus citri]|uniref:legumain-like isoform X2 n=1 Tax=Planococcus citri TaxID=170843 RepID=UPI0031F9DFD0
MKSHVALLFLLVCLNSIIYAHSKQFAVLVATTKSWLHYGHQSTVLHAYQTLIANGFPRSNIITMFYDDLANHPSNTEKGVIRNHPEGKNVYENVKKDYTGEKVTADNFIGVITGNGSLASGPVIKSGPKDTLFVYIAGLSTYQYLTFPSGPGISSAKLKQTLEKLTKEKKFKKVFVSADVSFADSLFDEIAPKSRVFVSTSTALEEHAHLVYCFPEKNLCHGSLYGVAWTQYSDRLRQLKSGAKRTLYDQFNYVRAETPYTHVNIYGDLRVGQSQLQEFIGYKFEGKRDANKVGLALDSTRVLSDDMQSQADAQAMSKNQPEFSVGTNYDQQMSNEEKSRTVKNRDFIKETMKNIFDHLQNNGYKNVQYEKAEKPRKLVSENHSDLYEDAIREFHERCININENPFALNEIPKLAHLITSNVSLDDLKTAMTANCNENHRLTANVY